MSNDLTLGDAFSDFMTQFIKTPFGNRAGISSLRTIHLTLVLLLFFACAEQKHTVITQSAARLDPVESGTPPAEHDSTHYPRSSRTYPVSSPEVMGQVTNRLGEAGAQEGQCNPGEILVRFRDGTDEQTIARIQKEVELKTIRLVSRPELYLMQVVGEISPEEAVQRLRRYREVIFAEPNYVRRIQ
jgi:hypothetical protein